METKTEDQDSPLKMKYSSHMSYDSPKSSLLFAAQSKSFGIRKKQIKKVVNPFLPRVQYLEKDACSPSLFVLSKSPKDEEFHWTIDDIARTKPAVFESPQYITLEYDEHTESQAQEVIERYFSETHSVVSPISSQTKSSQNTPSDAKHHTNSPAVSSTPCAKSVDAKRVIKIDAFQQTDLSLPPVLPPEVYAVLKPFFNKNDMDVDENNMNNSTLRRKLFFDHEEEMLSPVKHESRCLSSPSEPDYSIKASRMNWSFHKDNSGTRDELSSPGLSPINSISIKSFSSVNSFSHTSGFPFPDESNHKEISKIPNDHLALPLTRHHVIFNSTSKATTATQDTGYSTMEDFTN